ncbi:hypothetical protein AB0E83_07140 [Streptomyces sp. NPDC035033]|uniref:hypothetical protein n=1 Tax=Streptomyces sp. NPDC035033 TaxID=3155368 RepID=UPI003406FA28
MNHRITGRRLAAALVTLATVTAVTGTLVTVPAAAAPADAAAAGRCEPSAPGLLPVGAEVVSAGAFGFVTSCTDENGERTLTLHKPDGSTVVFGSEANVHDSFSDWMVTQNQGYLTHYNPTLGKYANHTLGGELAGVAHDVAYESRTAESGVGRELWQLENVNGIVRRTKLTDTVGNQFNKLTETDHKVVAAGRDANGRPVALVLVRGYGLSNQEQVPYTRHYVVSVPTGTPMVQETPSGTGGDWDAATTGAITAKYRALIVNPAEGGQQLYVYGRSRPIALTNVPGKAVLAGIIGDTALYAARRDPYAGPEVLTPLYALDLTQAAPVPVKVMENFSSVAHHGDGGLLVRGATGSSDGLFKVAPDWAGKPSFSLVADTGRVVALKVTRASLPASVSLEKPGTSVPFSVELSRPDARVTLTLTHTRSGKKLVRELPRLADGGSEFGTAWDGVLDGVSAPNGAYAWQVTATSQDGTATDTRTGTLTVTRTGNPHDFTDNGSTDVLARDAAGVLWRDDLYDWPVNGQAQSARRTRIGSGWNTYKHIEAAGQIGGDKNGDLVALDTAGVLWTYPGKGDGTFGTRVRVGGGWGVYTKLAGGSDWQTTDGAADLFAVDTAGYLWYYRGTGDLAKPYAPRIRVGGGWGVYNQITALGNVAGDGGGDLVARDKDGVLWLYKSNGYGFQARQRIGGGWNAFSQLVGAGDVDADGRPDLIAYGSGGTYVYRSTGSATAPFARMKTWLYPNEGTKFTNVS